MTFALSGERKSRSREFYLEAGREYVRRFGADQLVAAALNPASAKRGGRPDLLDRYYEGREDGSAWPSLNAVKAAFGGFIAYRKALGLPPNPTGGSHRRRPGEAEPIFTVRERRVVVGAEENAFIRKQLAAAERRALRAEERLEEAKLRVDEVPEEHERTVEALRMRLADERSRRKDVQRELNNATRREDRARARTQTLSPKALRDVDRLTERLAASEALVRRLQAAPGTVGRVPEVRTKIKTKVRTRTVEVADEKALRRAERAEKRVTELREELEAVRSAREDLANRLAGIRREAVLEAVATERVRSAERRVNEVEKKMAAMTELLIGERRQLTSAEVASLRTSGPAGHTVFLRAVKRVARTYAEVGVGAELHAALRESMSAAQNWIDRT